MRAIQEPLANFFTNWLHQDWDTEHDTVEDVIADFATTALPSTVLTALGQITAILASGPTHEELDHAMERAGLNYVTDPDASEWLAGVGRTMATAFVARRDVDAI